MRYVKKIPAADKELSKKLISDGWRKLKEPSSIGKAILISMPFMFLNGIIFMGVALYLYPPLRGFFESNNGLSITFTLNLNTLIYLVVFFIFMLAHEFIHASFIPKVLKSDNTCWGINGFFAFVYTTEEIKKSRFLVISIMPFLMLSILLPFILKFLGLLNGFTIFLSLVNAAGSSVDCLNMCMVAVQVPKGAYIRNNGVKTYFK